MEAREVLANAGCTNIEHYSLVNNDGYTFEYANTKYDARHVRNVYGASVNFWEISFTSGERVKEDILKNIEETLNKNCR